MNWWCSIWSGLSSSAVVSSLLSSDVCDLSLLLGKGSCRGHCCKEERGDEAEEAERRVANSTGSKKRRDERGRDHARLGTNETGPESELAERGLSGTGSGSGAKVFASFSSPSRIPPGCATGMSRHRPTSSPGGSRGAEDDLPYGEGPFVASVWVGAAEGEEGDAYPTSGRRPE